MFMHNLSLTLIYHILSSRSEFADLSRGALLIEVCRYPNACYLSAWFVKCV